MKRVLGAISIIALLLIIYVFSLSYTSPQQNNLNVSNIQINSEGYSMYNISCDLTPNKEYDYLQMKIVFYDANGANIGGSSLVWNENNPKKEN